MLSGAHFDYQLTRKYVTIFGTIFNDILLIKRDDDTGLELERIKVPIVYGPKEKYRTRIEQDPDLLKSVSITLPRMSYEIKSMSYDAARKQNTLLRQARSNTSIHMASQYMGVPYNFQFDLTIYSRNIKDGNQIVEQILPYFTPDYTVTINPIPEMGHTKDIPIILDSIAPDITYEGNYDSVRYVMHTLSFTLKGYFWGPTNTSKIIRKVITNIFNDPSLQAGYITRVNMGAGDGNYVVNDTVYQGDNYQTARAYGIVLSWDAGTTKLVLGGTQGQFKVNNVVKGVSSNASYTIDSFDATPLKLAKIVIEPDPLTAQPTDDFGYTTTITEFPNAT